MSQQRIDRPGIFKATIDDWKIVAAESGAKGINFTFHILAKLEQVVDANGNQASEWQDWAQYGMVAYGTWWLVKKDRTINIDAAEQLARSFGWDGDLDRLDGYPPGDIVQITVKADTYKGQTQFKASWMEPEDYAGGGGGGAGPDDVAAMKAEFGSLLRAACSGAAKARAAAAQAPAQPAQAAPVARAPATRQRRAAAPAAPPVQAPDIPDDQIPF